MKKALSKKEYIVLAVFAVLSVFLLFDTLSFKRFGGLNIPIFYAVFVAAVLISGWGNIKISLESTALLLLGFLFSLSYYFFNNSLLLFLNLMSAIICSVLSIILMYSQERQEFNKNLVGEAFYTAFVRPVHRIQQVINSLDKKKKPFLYIIGVIISVPVIALFIPLLCEADAVFKSFVLKFLNACSVAEVFLKIAMFAVVFVLASSGVFSMLNVVRRRREQPKKEYSKNCLIPIYMLLSSLAVLLLGFSAIQCLFLFMRAELPEGISYSAYAHEGFYQLCIAAALVYLIIIICSKLTNGLNGKGKGFLNILYTILLLSCIIMCASSFYRLVIYEREFYFTRLRIYVQFFVSMMAVISLAAIAKLWYKKIDLTRTVFYISMISLLSLTYFNADAYIAQQNSLHINTAADVYDMDYLAGLSIDALPYYIDRINTSLPYEDGSLLEFNLVMHKHTLLEEKEAEPIYHNIGRQKAMPYLEKLTELRYE